MLTQAWMNGIAVAVVAGSLAAAWRAIRKPAERAQKPTVNARKTDAQAKRRVAEPERDPRPWRIYLNEAEIARREASKIAAAHRPADEESASAGSKR
ncbi:MAG: hypothetical protein WCB58_20040 [Acidobacteriaceae bacterium]